MHPAADRIVDPFDVVVKWGAANARVVPLKWPTMPQATHYQVGLCGT